MSNNWGHIRKVTQIVGGSEITFRSMGEYRWCVYCQLRKERGLIKDWFYEDEVLELVSRKFRDPITYIPDFTVQTPDGSYEFHECKGWFTSKSATKLRLMADQYENPITLIFAAKPNRVQYNRAKHLEPHIKRIIWNANRDIFKKIEHLFEI